MLAQKAAAAPIDRFELLSLRQKLLAHLGERQRQRAELDELARLAGDDAALRLTIYQRYGRLFNDLGDHDAAVVRLEAALDLARQQNDAEAEAATLAVLGQTIYWHGDLSAAAPVLRRAIERARAAGAIQAEADAQTTLSGVLYDLSEHEGATAAAERAVALNQDLDNPVGEADVLATLGAVAMEQGRLDDADAYFARALPVIQSSGYRYAEARCLVNWGSIDYLRGRLGDALDRFRLGAQIFAQIGSERTKHYAHLNIAATLSTYVGPDDEAEALTRTALEFLTGSENGTVAQALGILGQFAYLRGALDEALRLHDQSMEGVDENPDPWVAAQSHQSRAVIHLAQAAWAAALRDTEAGLSICEQYGFADLAPLVLALQSQALLGLGQTAGALAAARRAAEDRAESAYGAHLIHWYHHRILAHAGDADGAQAALARAHRRLETLLSTLSPQDQARSRAQIPEHRAILAAWEEQRPVQQSVRLPRPYAPTGRPITADEEVEVTWTVESAADRAISSKTERRRAQLLRLLRQAADQGGLPAYHHLADALGVSERTIKRDMAALRQTEAELPPTRGG